MHDVGLRLLDYERMYRRPNLTAEELRGLAEHPVIGAALVEPILGTDVAQAVLRHHERVDGKGYPDGLTGDQISIGAKIVNVADAFDAMTTDRPYRAGFTVEKALEQMVQKAGSQFAAEIVEVFVAALKEGRIRVTKITPGAPGNSTEVSSLPK